MKKTNLIVGNPSIGRVTEGSRASFNKAYSKDARESMKEVVAGFTSVVDSIKKITPDALIEALSPTFDKAQKYCPKDTRALVESGLLETETEHDFSKPKASITFGRGLHYAAIVHERTDLHHKPPTRSKYLQAAVEEDLGVMKRRFARAIKRVMGGT